MSFVSQPSTLNFLTADTQSECNRRSTHRAKSHAGSAARLQTNPTDNSASETHTHTIHSPAGSLPFRSAIASAACDDSSKSNPAHHPSESPSHRCSATAAATRHLERAQHRTQSRPATKTPMRKCRALREHDAEKMRFITASLQLPIRKLFGCDAASRTNSRNATQSDSSPSPICPTSAEANSQYSTYLALPRRSNSSRRSPATAFSSSAPSATHPDRWPRFLSRTVDSRRFPGPNSQALAPNHRTALHTNRRNNVAVLRCSSNGSNPSASDKVAETTLN